MPEPKPIGLRQAALLETLREALAGGDLRVEIAQESDRGGIFERLLDTAAGLDDLEIAPADEDRGGALEMRFGDMLASHAFIPEHLSRSEIDQFAKLLADAAVDQLFGSSS